MAPGPRNAVLIFESANGAQTAPSVPIQLSVLGGTNLLSASQIAIGPPGTARRIIAFTPAYGSSYFYITPSYIPSTAGLGPILSLGTIINNNTTLSAIFDFSDAQLTAGTEIDVEGNNLFNQVVLAPCLGCIEYQGRMGWWGEINDVKNLVNAHFDGGYIPLSGTVNVSGTSVTLATGDEWIDIFGVPVATGSTIYINGVPYVIHSIASGTGLSLTTSAGSQTGVPYYILSPNGGPVPGWSSTQAYLIAQPDKSLGFACVLVASSTLGATGQISQPCYQDYYGAPILEENTPYIVRFQGACAFGGATAASVTVTISSPTLGTLAQNHAILSNGEEQWITISLPVIPLIPSDATLIIEFAATIASGANATLAIDELEIINAQEPVLFQQMRLSYFDNPFGYDDLTGLIASDRPVKLTAAFAQRSYLYALTDGPLYQTQDNGTTEPSGWNFTSFADECDCYGPNAVTSTEDVAWWAGQSGFRVFGGGPPKKISQEIQPTWELIADANPCGIWVCNDPEERLVYIGANIPTLATDPNVVLTMSYRSVDAAYNVPDPLHTSYSGKLIATDLCRKWTRWLTPMLCGAILTQFPNTGPTKTMFFGGQLYSNIYSLDFAKYTDDDYGAISSYYVTYFFFNHDIEQNVPQLGLHQKMYTYLTAYVTGVGLMQPQLLMNNLANPWGTTATVWDPTNMRWTASGSPSNPLAAISLTNGVLLNDLEWGLNVNQASRLAVKWASQPLPGETDQAFQLTHMVLSGHQQKVAPIRGTNN